MSGCVALVLTVALIQVFLVLEVPWDHGRAVYFILPMLVGGFFGSLLVAIRRLRRNVERQHQEILRLSEELSRDLRQSDRKLQSAHKELELGERLRVVGLLGAQVAHDFNNLLTATVGAAWLIEPGASDDDLKESRTLILDASERAAGLCSLILGFSRPSEEEPAVTNLDQVLKEMEPILRKLVSREVAFNIKQQSDLPMIAAERGRVEMCLLNLVINSNDAAPTGSISVETRSSEDGIELSVTDDGEGMDAETLANVRKPFFTTKGTGTGLGLSVVGDAMEQVGGGMYIVSEPGQGTTVALRFKQVI